MISVRPSIARHLCAEPHLARITADPRFHLKEGAAMANGADVALEQALADQKLSATAVENIRVWLSEDRYADYCQRS